MEELEMDPQPIQWTDNFITGRTVSLVINGHEGAMEPRSTGILQGSPVSPILFAIYISEIFDKVEGNSEGISLSFVDDISWLVTSQNATEITEKLQ